jgi:gliding motility-associated-like protein
VIQYDSIPLFSLGPDLVLCSNQQIILNPNISNANFLWQDGTTASTFTVKKQGYYKLISSNQCGAAFDEINITEGSCSLFVPSAFSPNDDGLNDIFKPIVYGQLIAYEFDVFDRWGNQVFHSTNAADGWDGKVKGNHYNPGVFIC